MSPEVRNFFTLPILRGPLTPKDSLVALGAVKLAFDLLASNGHSPAAYASALRLMAALCEGSASAQMAVTGTGLCARLAMFPESAGNSGPVAQGGEGRVVI